MCFVQVGHVASRDDDTALLVPWYIVHEDPYLVRNGTLQSSYKYGDGSLSAARLRVRPKYY